MTVRLAMRTLVVTLAFMAATAIGWWAVPVGAALFGAITWRDRAGPTVASFGAMLAWTALLVWNALLGPVENVAATLGGVLQIRPFAVYVLTLAFAGLLALCAAIVARGAMRFAHRHDAASPASTASPT